MSRLEIPTPSRSQLVIEGLYKDLERRIEASPPGLCPVDITRAFLELCHAQTCGKCVPCRVGLLQLKHLITDVLNGKATMDTLTPDGRNSKIHYGNFGLCHRLRSRSYGLQKPDWMPGGL